VVDVHVCAHRAADGGWIQLNITAGSRVTSQHHLSCRPITCDLNDADVTLTCCLHGNELYVPFDAVERYFEVRTVRTHRTHCVRERPIRNESVPKIIINNTINLFLTAISIFVISNHNSFFYLKNIFIFKHGKWPAHGTSTVPIVSAHFLWLGSKSRYDSSRL